MPTIETLLFLACFALVPLGMIALPAYRLARWVKDRRAVGALRERGWTPIATDDPALRDALDDLRLTTPRARFSDAARLGEGDSMVLVATRCIPRSGGTDPSLGGGSTHTYVIGARAGAAPVGVVSRRAGGVLEAAALGVASAIGGAPLEPPGWQWAIVSSPSAQDAWSAGAGAAMDAQVRPGEQIHLGARHVAFASRDRMLARVMGEARVRLQAIASALRA